VEVEILFGCDFETAQEAAQVLVSIETSNCSSIISEKKKLKKIAIFSLVCLIKEENQSYLIGEERRI